MKVKKCCSISCFVIGVLLTIIGIVLLIVIPIIVKNTVKKSVPLVDGSFADQQWSNPPYAVYFDVWLFNVTNPDEVLHRGAKPSMNEKGPYSFIEKQRKVQINRLDSTNISYQNLKEYFFNSPTSCLTCKEEDLFIIPNVPYLTAVNMLNNMHNLTDFYRSMLNLALMAIGEHPFVMKNARSLLFEGYKDQIFSLLQLVKNLVPAFAGMPDRMGFFYPQNLSCDGIYDIDSGIDNVDNVGKIWTWNGNSSLNYWFTKEANMINGSDGTLYPPFLTKSSTLRMFVSSICRSVYATYYSDVTVDGIPGYRYYIPDSVFNATNPDNWGFCSPTAEMFYPHSQIPLPPNNFTDFGNLTCMPSGFLNLSKCQFGAPVFLTSPHFLFCPEEVLTTLTGITPPGEHDMTFLDMEPTSAVMMNVARKIQLSVAMPRDRNYLMLKYIKPVIIPVLFLNESAAMNSQMRDYLYKNVVFTQNLAYGVCYACLALGLLLVVSIGIAFLVLLYRRPIFGRMYDQSLGSDSPRSSVTVIGSDPRRHSGYEASAASTNNPPNPEHFSAGTTPYSHLDDESGASQRIDDNQQTADVSLPRIKTPKITRVML